MKLALVCIAIPLIFFCSCKAQKSVAPTAPETPRVSPIDDALRRDDGNSITTVFEVVSKKRDRVGFAKLSHAEQVFYAVSVLEMEVNNGGFDQFFFNSAGDYAHEAYDGLNEIGAKKMAAIVKRALAIFPEGRAPKDRGDRWDLLEPNEEKNAEILNKLDNEFYKYPDPIGELLMKFVRTNRSQFD